MIPVSLLVSSARLLLERHIGLIWVAGEISGFTRAASGHCYFSLKDDKAQVRCVLFRHKAQFADFTLKDGLAIEARATASIYEARGEFQLNVESVRLSGLGALYEKFARLKARLEAAGWFAAERKRALPPHPRAVGIVTSLQAAALRDVLTTLKRRWPALPVFIYPAAVQGAGAAAEIANAIVTANARAETDVLIVCRGGGSIEDLWAFNEEAVAKAVFESRLPIVSGIGHETDFTICDFVADARAPTPTGAAALVAPDRRAALDAVAALATRWRQATIRAMETQMQRVDGAARRLVHPASRLEAQTRELDTLAGRMSRALGHRMEIARRQVDGWASRYATLARRPFAQGAALASAYAAWQRAGRLRVERIAIRIAGVERSLAHLNPQSVLLRGYAIVTTADGRIVHDAKSVSIGDDVALAFARGNAGAKITKVER